MQALFKGLFQADLIRNITTDGSYMAIDRARIIAELGLDAEIVNELVTEFVTQTEETLKALEAAVAAGDFTAISDTAHSIKGSSGNLRMDDLYNLCKETEMNAKGPKDITAIQALLVKIRAAFEEIKKG